MIIPGSDITTPFRASADVCIIGSGCGGGATAKVLAEAGKSVIVLEEGGYYAPSDLRPGEEWGFTNLYQQRGGLATEDLAVTVLSGRAVGGSSLINWTTSLRTPEFVLNFWAKHRRVSGHGMKDLEPYFERVERYLNVHAEPDERHNHQNRIILEGAQKLGYRSGANGRNVDNCAGLGLCGLGCPIGAKKSVDLTYLADAVKAGATIHADCRADRIIQANGKRTVVGSVLDRATRKPRTHFEIEASVVIVAGSSILSPLILQRSGIAVNNGHLGRHLTFHLTSAVVGEFEEPQYPWKGIPQSAFCNEFVNRNGDGGGFWMEAAPVGPALAASGFPGFGASHRSIVSSFAHFGVTIILVKEIDSEGAVHGSDLGRPVISYDRGPRDTAYLRQALAEAARIQFAAGAKVVRTLHARPVVMNNPGEIDAALARAGWGNNELSLYSAHPLGTVRMGDDPRGSVVNSHGKVHGADGVFVIDGSVLPSSLGVNPQITILSIATQNAEWLADHWASAAHNSTM